MALPIRFHFLSKLKIRWKFLLTLLLISIIPMLITNVLWINAHKEELLGLPVMEMEETAHAEFMRQTAIQATILLAISLGLAIAFGLFISKQITSPILKLKEGSQKISSGDLTYRLQAGSEDELGDIARFFNSIAVSTQASIEKLKAQHKLSDRSAALLLQKDLDLRKSYDELINEKLAISAERNKLWVTMQSITDGVLVLDMGGRIIMINSAALILLAFDREQVLGRKIEEVLLVTENGAKIPMANFLPHTRLEADSILLQKYNAQIITYTNKKLSVSLTSSAIKEGMDVGLGAIITLHDISKEKELEEMRLDFVSMAAHELRTPLTTIKGYLSVFIRENSGKLTPEQNLFLGRISIATQQLSTLTENLLNVSRIEKGTLSATIAATNWVTTVGQIVDQFQEQTKEKKLQMTFVKPSEFIPMVAADKLRVTEVLSNLITNAISYTQQGGAIRVWVEVKGDEVTTHVADTGQGIPKEAIPHLFTKFFRVAGPLAEGSKGTGLGLYITKAIIEMHHGRIWVESEVGEGSTFSFTLPVYRTNQHPSQVSKTTIT